MTNESEVEREIERLVAVVVPYICEHTGLSEAQVIRVMQVQEEFWDKQPHVIGRLFVLGFEVEGEDSTAC